MEPKQVIQIGNLVIIKGRNMKPGKVIDISHAGFPFYERIATVGWQVKHRNLRFLSTKKIRVKNLVLYIPTNISLIDEVKKFFYRR